MPSKTQELEEKVTKLSGRVSNLTDEIAVLKGEFNNMLQRIQQDMHRVITKVEK